MRPSLQEPRRQVSLEDFWGILESWRETIDQQENALLNLSEDPPPTYLQIKDIYAEVGEEISKSRYEELMYQAMQMGIVGMDGFKYCWPEVAKDILRRCRLA